MRWVRARSTAILGLTVAAVGGPLPAVADRAIVDAPPPPRGRVLEVPFVPQSRALCGGAALAMVMRFWGEPAVLAEEFADRIAPGGAGIRTDDLVSAARARGWSAYPATGMPSDVQTHLERGRPIIALIQLGSNSLHYVVIVGWGGGSVIVHDPAHGPLRAIEDRAFDRAWAGRGRWYLLVLPSRSAADSAAETTTLSESSSTIRPGRCDSIVDEGIRRARIGDTAGAEERFVAARATCPTLAAPVRELAGMRFIAGDWTGAAGLAESALVLDSGDSLASRLLAGSRFLSGDVEGALGAWNRLAEPHVDVLRIEGLSRTRYRAVADQIGLPPGQFLRPEAFLRARRRLEEMPSHSGSRLSLIPRSGGRAQPDVALRERPLLFDGPWDAGQAVVRALVEREAVLKLASPTGNGELWSAGWRWSRARPHASLALAVPAAGGRPGLWRVAGYRDRQTYAAGPIGITDDPGSAARITEDRRRAELSFGDWIAPNVRLEGGAAFDRWTGRGRHLSLDGRIEIRSARDRLTLAVTMAGWRGIDGGAPFAAGDVLAQWGSQTPGQGGWRARAGASSVTLDAPLALWPGAGTGTGRAPLLRAHPLLDGGVITGRAFGRSLVHGGLERQSRTRTVRPLRLGWTLFLDAARPWNPLGAPVPWQVDAGAGIRLAGMGSRGRFRMDLARGFDDGRVALSIGWETR